MERRRFLTHAAMLPLALVGSQLGTKANPATHAFPGRPGGLKPTEDPGDPDDVTLFLCGDVMTGRGIDQVLSNPGDPRLHEPYVRSATRYVELAKAKNGSIPAPVDYSYV